MFPERIRENAETVLLLQNMLFGILLFKRQSKSEMVFISVIVLLAVVARFNRYYMEQNSPFIFAGISRQSLLVLVIKTCYTVSI